MRLLDQGQAIAVKHEERDVVVAPLGGAAPDELALDSGDLELERELARRAEPLAHRVEDEVIDVHVRSSLRSFASSAGFSTTPSASSTSDEGPSVDATAILTAKSRPRLARPRNASRSVVSSPA